MKYEIFVGAHIHRWTLSRPLGLNAKHRSMWQCQCSCGTIRAVTQSTLRNGTSRFCGCLQKEAVRSACTKHGMSHSGEYYSYWNMKQRCENPNSTEYARYGGCGVVICARWRNSFVNFFADMGPKPTPDHSIDRYPNCAGNYEPGNCRWATPVQQSNNQRTSRVIAYRGRSQTVAEWARERGVSYKALLWRIDNDWTPHDALTIPVVNDGWTTRRRHS